MDHSGKFVVQYLKSHFCLSCIFFNFSWENLIHESRVLGQSRARCINTNCGFTAFSSTEYRVKRESQRKKESSRKMPFIQSGVSLFASDRRGKIETVCCLVNVIRRVSVLDSNDLVSPIFRGLNEVYDIIPWTVSILPTGFRDTFQILSSPVFLVVLGVVIW